MGKMGKLAAVIGGTSAGSMPSLATTNTNQRMGGPNANLDPAINRGRVIETDPLGGKPQSARGTPWAPPQGATVSPGRQIPVGTQGQPRHSGSTGMGWRNPTTGAWEEWDPQNPPINYQPSQQQQIMQRQVGSTAAGTNMPRGIMTDQQSGRQFYAAGTGDRLYLDELQQMSPEAQQQALSQFEAQGQVRRTNQREMRAQRRERAVEQQRSREEWLRENRPREYAQLQQRRLQQGQGPAQNLTASDPSYVGEDATEFHRLPEEEQQQRLDFHRRSAQQQAVNQEKQRLQQEFQAAHQSGDRSAAYRARQEMRALRADPSDFLADNFEWQVPEWAQQQEQQEQEQGGGMLSRLRGWWDGLTKQSAAAPKLNLGDNSPGSGYKVKVQQPTHTTKAIGNGLMRRSVK